MVVDHASGSAPAPDGRFARALDAAGVNTRALPETWRTGAVRRARRYAARMAVGGRAWAGGPSFQGITENVSRTGVLFRTDTSPPPPVGTTLDLTLDLPRPTRDGLPPVVTLRGDVVRVTLDTDFGEMLPAVAVAVEWRDGDW